MLRSATPAAATHATYRRLASYRAHPAWHHPRMPEVDVSVEGGPGRRLVLLHGFTQGPRSWDQLVAGLDPSSRSSG